MGFKLVQVNGLGEEIGTLFETEGMPELVNSVTIDNGKESASLAVDNETTQVTVYVFERNDLVTTYGDIEELRAIRERADRREKAAAAEKAKTSIKAKVAKEEAKSSNEPVKV